MVGKLKIHKSTIVFKIKRFQDDWEVPETKEVISDFDFSKELFERHQESLWRKFKRLSVNKSHLFKKIIKIKLTKMFRQIFSTICLDKFLKRMWLVVEWTLFWLILANWLPNSYSWFSWMFLLKLSLQVFIT